MMLLADIRMLYSLEHTRHQYFPTLTLLPSSVRSLSTPKAVLTNPFTKEEARLALAESGAFVVLNPGGQRSCWANPSVVSKRS